jgi:uncharacterized protein (TIGR00296 family)
MDLTLKEGRFLVKFARKSIKAYFGGKKPEIPEDMKYLMSKKSAVFVRLLRYPSHTLRGCFGYTEGIMPLNQLMGDVSLSAAIRDPRFHPMRGSELDTTLIEVSILSKPELLRVGDAVEYPRGIKVGRDGLIVEKNSIRGVLLPQIAAESKWNSREFLSRACMKAGLSPNAWNQPDIGIYRFSAQVFVEDEPIGKIVGRKPG